MIRIVNALGKLNRVRRAYAVLALSSAAAMALPAQTFTTLFSFDGTNGADPLAGLIRGTDGDFYGTTNVGGAYCASNGGCGTIFKITPSGTLATLHSFCAQSECPDGSEPSASLVQATNGDLYGTTVYGGANGGPQQGSGTVFKITPSGSLTTLYNFCSQSNCADGSNPDGGLIQATDGDLYGTNCCQGLYGGGTVFKINPGGTLTTLYTFCSQSGCTDGSRPWGVLVQAANGDFYGTNEFNGAYGAGTVFKMTPSGSLTTLHSFCYESTFPNCRDGAAPTAGLVQAANGDFYGTTSGGGNITNAPCSGFGCGTIFKTTPGGTLTTLHAFCSLRGCPDGIESQQGGGALVQATDGDFYGTTGEPFSISNGTIFKMTPPSGTLKTLYHFCSQSGCPDGDYPNSLVQDTNGELYGTTYNGGASGIGTVFSLSVGLRPFVETRPTTGKVGEKIKIVGTDLTGATSVTFNGTAAAFTVKSPSLITTTVPAGATTGTVQVVTPSGTLSSNVPFRVRP